MNRAERISLFGCSPLLERTSRCTTPTAQVQVVATGQHAQQTYIHSKICELDVDSHLNRDDYRNERSVSRERWLASALLSRWSTVGPSWLCLWLLVMASKKTFCCQHWSQGRTWLFGRRPHWELGLMIRPRLSLNNQQQQQPAHTKHLA